MAPEALFVLEYDILDFSARDCLPSCSGAEVVFSRWDCVGLNTVDVVFALMQGRSAAVQGYVPWQVPIKFKVLREFSDWSRGTAFFRCLA